MTMNENNEIYEVAASVFKTAKPISEQVMSEKVFHFPLSSAYLCENCHNVANISTICPSCASTVSMVSLGNILK